MKLNKRVIALVMLGLMGGTGQIYAGNQMDDVDMEFVQITAEQQKKLEDEIAQNKKLAEEYNSKLKLEAEKFSEELAKDTELENSVKVVTPVVVANSASTDFRKNITQTRETEVWQKNNFLDMRIAFEELTNTKVTSAGPEGLLYTTYGSGLGGDWENTKTKDINYNWGVGSKYMDILLANKEMQSELAKLSSLTFKDIKGTEWYAKHIVPAVYYGLINGYPDGTFKGNAPVSRAEFAVMAGNSEREFMQENNLPFPQKLSAHKNQWYYLNMGPMMGGPMGMYSLTVNDMNSGISRGEVALILAYRYFSKEFYTEYDKVSKSSFKDITDVGKTLFELSDSEKRTGYMNDLKTPNTACKEVVAALNLLKAKGVMIGDEKGNSNWTKTVTRGEAVALFERCGHLYIH